jgi:hypothetical protein
VSDLVDPTHLWRWPGGGEPHFLMLLWRIGYGHAVRCDNPGSATVSLWTPGGDHPVGPTDDEREETGAIPDLGNLSSEDQAQLQAMQAEMDRVRQQLLEAPASVVVANHGMGLYELAAIHLTTESPKLAEASLAIDALAILVDGLGGRLGEAETTLREALAQLRAAYLEVHTRTRGDDGAPPA